MDWLTLTTQIATIISVIFAAISIRSNTYLSRKQWNVDTFNTYSERHLAAIKAFPDNAFYNRFDESKLPERSPELTFAVRNYLFVICNVHYLAYHKYLEESIWNAWRRDMERTLNSPLIAREWCDIKSEFEYFEPFAQFVEENQTVEENQSLEKNKTGEENQT
ncbi:MAG: hypothetical protein AAFU53_01380 [Cyanobacteria bacterium J06632_3]